MSAGATVTEGEPEVVEIGAASAVSLPLPEDDGSVDRVRIGGRPTGGGAELMAEVHRVLREGGVVAVTLGAGWWTTLRWERGFTLAELDPAAPATRVELRRLPGTVSAAELEPGGNDPAELAAVRDAVERLGRAVDELRESFHSELGRKSARIAHLEQLVHETDSGYRATLSWRATAPLRAAGKLARSARRRP
jgi:hypothetical protein